MINFKTIVKNFSVILCVCSLSARAQSINYFGQTPPGETPRKFAPGIISKDDRKERVLIFSNDGQDCFMEILTPDYKSKIFSTEYKDNEWSEFIELPFSIDNYMSSPFIADDNQALYFTTTKTDFNGLDVYCTKRTNGAWSEPALISQPINSSLREIDYFEKNDVAYVTSNRAGGKGGLDIWEFSKDNGEFTQSKNMDLNSSSFDFGPCISPDGSYLVFGSERNGRNGRAHLYICFKKPDGNWTEPINMNSAGAEINNNSSHHSATCISPDGKYLFFMRHDDDIMDTYWVSTSVIDKLKNIAIPTSMNESKATNIQLYPNPAKESILIKGGDENGINYRLVEPLGKVVKQGLILSGKLDISGIEKGIYLFQYEINNRLMCEKLMIK